MMQQAPGHSMMAAGMGGGGMGGGGMGGGGMGGGGMMGAGQQMMSEEAYIQHCRQFTAQKNVPYNEAQVRQYYRQMRAMMANQ